jgi:hypothetical protein
MAKENEIPRGDVQIITENSGEVYRIPAAEGPVVVMPPTKLLRLVRILIELDRLKEFKQHPHVIEHEIILPLFAYAELSNFSGNKKTEANLTEFSFRISLQNFVELLEGVVRNNKFDQAITILRTIDTEMFLMIPAELSNQIKIALHEISKTQKAPRDCSKVLFKANLWL